MKSTCLSFLLLAHNVWAHGDHGGAKPGEDMAAYAQRHMSSEHHIDSFDLRSFFQLHDLNRDGFWDREEVEAIYGVHHVYSQKKSKDEEEHQKKADHISGVVMNLLDKNKDGKVSPEEFEAVGLDGLPSFESLGAEGHHYDIESEFFLHHEEQFHSTPETQTDESYNHPEDIEHFAHHEEIERKEAIKEAAFQGVSVEEVLESHEPHDHPEAASPAEDAPKPKVTRVTPPEKQDPSVKFKDAKTEGARKAEWGSGPEGYKTPKNPSDKMRKNLPYKYKFRRNWGDF